MIDGTGLYYGKRYDIKLVTGKYIRTTTLLPITSASSQDDNTKTIAEAGLAISILSIILVIVGGLYFFQKSSSTPLSSSSAEKSNAKL